MKTEILVEVDNYCQMAKVSVGEKCIMEGNFWDFHPGCHGIYLYGNFNSYSGLALLLRSNMLDCGFETDEVEIIKREYKYES